MACCRDSERLAGFADVKAEDLRMVRTCESAPDNADATLWLLLWSCNSGRRMIQIRVETLDDKLTPSFRDGEAFLFDQALVTHADGLTIASFALCSSGFRAARDQQEIQV